MLVRTLTAAALLAALAFPAAAMADENGTVGGAVAGGIGGAIVGGPVGLVVGGVGGAVVGNRSVESTSTASTFSPPKSMCGVRSKEKGV